MTKTPIATLGIDLGKNSCSLAGLDASGAIVLRRRLTREGVIKFVAALPAAAWEWHRPPSSKAHASGSRSMRSPRSG